MQIINNQFSANQLQQAERPLELKQGELYKAQIKERISDTEAIVQIRGKEVKATFEGQVPAEDRVTVQVTGQKDQSVLVKTMSAENLKSPAPESQPSDAKVLQSVGITAKDTPELKQSVQMLLDKGMPVTKEAVQELRDFFEKAQGSAAAKLDTVKALVNKRLEVTQSHLRPIHEALHGRPLNEVLTDLATEIDPEFDLAKNEQNDVQKRTETENIVKAARTGNAETTAKELTELLHKNRELVEKAPDLKLAIEKVRSEIVNNPAIDRELAQKIEKAAYEAEKLQSIGKERLVQALQNAEEQLVEKDERSLQAIKQMKETVQNESNIQRVTNVVRDLLKINKDIGSEIKSSIEKMVNQASQLDQAGRERLSKILEQAANIPQFDQQKTESVQDNNQKLSTILAGIVDQESAKEETNPSMLIKEALKQIQKAANLEQALTQIQKEVSSSPNLDIKTIEKVENAVEHSTQLLDKGRELGARQLITKALNEIEQELANTEPRQQPVETKGVHSELLNQFEQNEQFQTLPLETKNILVTKVTQKLAQAAHDFRELKREITRNLDTIERLANIYKKNAYPQAKQILQTTINKLDNAILKSDMMLFTDMKTEKQLMQASTQLAEAKKLLAKGNHAEAAKIVYDIKTLVDKINFKPSEQKVMHFVSKESTNLEQHSPSQQLLKHFDETARSNVRQEPSARQMFEMVRSLGLNHDSDLAKSLVFEETSTQRGQDHQNQQENVKATLMKLALAGGDEASTKIAQQAEQALNNLTGQQLLSKSDSGNTLQSMFFSLPLLLGEKPENLQVFVNSKKEGQQVDWENCNLYFLIETKKLGDVGIMLSSTERNLSITIKNDKPGFKQKMEPLAAITKEKLQEVGYSVNSINFTRMTPIASRQQSSTNNEEQQTELRPVFTEKGMDFKI
ncbi:hypothetical protein ACNQFZ_13390 [Schinkia sp. CFF1]